MAIDLFDEEVKSDYITIGGKQRPTHNSNGDLIYPTVQGIVNFYKWFGNSKVVDSQGRPLVVYHGSGTKELFDIFNNGQGRAGSKLYIGSYWFTDNYKMAQSYANVYERDYVTGYQSDKIIDKNPIYAGYLRIVKPFVVDFEGANWDGDAIGKVSLYQIVFGQKQLIKKSKTQTFFDSYEEAYLRAQQMGLPEDKYEIYTDSVRPEGATDDIIHQQLEKRIKKKVIKYVGQEVVRAFKNKNASDGAIFQNIVDYGHINDDEDVTTIPTGTDFVIYSPNQFKSINNSGYFSKSDKMNETFEMNKILENAGVSLPNENSLGEKIIPDDDPVKLQNFWNWFGNSKLIDEQGRPLVVYHGTNAKFNIFNNEKPIWVTPRERYASMYSDTGNVMPVYAKLENPANVDNINGTLHAEKAQQISQATGISEDELYNIYKDIMGNTVSTYVLINSRGFRDALIKKGFDGIKAYEAPHKTYAVFEPNQIKSINNNGEFSMSSDNIYESRVNKNLKESLEFHSKLNNKIWNGFKLKEKVHDALYKIADVFTRSLEVPNLELEDVVITGSLCNYNYNKNSDIDLHLVVDFEKLGITPEDFVQKYFNAKKTEFNTKHDIKVYGYPVELYVEDVKSPARASGRYSLLDNQWINTPKGMKDEVVDISDNKKYKEYVDKIDSLEDDDASLEHASDLLSEIYDMRASGLEKDGELSEDNLVFKELRNGGYLDKLREYMIDTMDDELSLTESYRRLSEGFYDESSEEEKIKTIKKYPRFIEDMDNPSVAVQMAAIENDPMNISYIKNPAPEVQMDAVQRDIFVLNYIKKPAVEVQVYAVEQDPNNITYIKKPSKAAIKKAVELNPDLLEIYYEGGRNKIPVDVLLPIIKNAKYYQISELILMAARSGLSKNPEIQAAFVEKDPDFILHFENPTNEAYVAYINHDWKNIYKLYNKEVYITTEMIDAVIKQAYKQGELPKAIDELMKIVFLYPENLLTAINLDYNVLDLVVNVAKPDKWRSEHYEIQSVPEKIKNKARKLGWKG